MGQTEDVARRIRTARAYAGLSRIGLARHLEVSAETVKRMELEKLNRPIRQSELLLIAEVTKVPRWFMLRGWAGAALSRASPDEAFAAELERQAAPLRERTPEPGTTTPGDHPDTTGR